MYVDQRKSVVLEVENFDLRNYFDQPTLQIGGPPEAELIDKIVEKYSKATF